MLEVIDKGSVSASHPVPLLFVHGAWHAAWCWDEHFLDFFAARGYRALALSLRGHGGSTTATPLRKLSFDDYLEDIASVTAGLAIEPVIVGHSMGGFLVQKYLQSRTAPAGVLLASMPPTGYLSSGLRWLKRHPWHFASVTVTGRSLPFVSTPELARERFFSPGTPESVVRRYAARLQEESARSGVDGIRDLPRPGLVTTDMLVLGALEDGAVTPAEVRATGKAYRTEAHLFAGMGHNMMLEPGWESVAKRMVQWFDARGL
ncbi:alpha/beta hydrolase [Mycolicibacterium sp. CR10]|uniref:alpha/beta hydrolase n=1 Tax=Mycolicibacterium sp. CR10 TaxID=2562314 RepID=UPI0010C1487B|nr:alpha/beta fold hydrolase [Mycolicibacterium sp. CR10]